MSERQASVDRRAKAMVYPAGEQVDILLPLGSFSAEAVFLKL